MFSLNERIALHAHHPFNSLISTLCHLITIKNVRKLMRLSSFGCWRWHRRQRGFPVDWSICFLTTSGKTFTWFPITREPKSNCSHLVSHCSTSSSSWIFVFRFLRSRCASGTVHSLMRPDHFAFDSFLLMKSMNALLTTTRLVTWCGGRGKGIDSGTRFHLFHSWHNWIALRARVPNMFLIVQRAFFSRN